MDTQALLEGRAALIVGHPGHELRLHHWLETAKPVVCVITDGSGSRGVGRLDSTLRVLHSAGARRGPIFGPFTDRNLYEQLAAHQLSSFLGLVNHLVESLTAIGVDYVVADAAEGFNPTHDICRYVTDAVVARLARVCRRRIPSFEFNLEAAPDARVGPDGTPAVHIGLEGAALDRKIAAARNYPELNTEVEATIAKFGPGAFSVECLLHAASGTRRWVAPDVPAYEHYGRQRVADGLYSSVLTYADHIGPLQLALRPDRMS